MNRSSSYQTLLLIIFLMLIYNTLSLKNFCPGIWEISTLSTEALFTASFSLVTSISVYYITALIPSLITRAERIRQLQDEINMFINRAEELMESTGLLFKDDAAVFFDDPDEMKKVNAAKGLTHYGHVEGRNRMNLGLKLVRLKELRDRLRKRKTSPEYADLQGNSCLTQINKLTESSLFHPNNDYLRKSETELNHCEIGVWDSLLTYRKMIDEQKLKIK